MTSPRHSPRCRGRRAQAVVVPNTSLLNPLGARIAGLALQHGLPSVGQYRRAAGYVGRILKGATPGDLSMEGPTTFETIVNLKTAKALGLSSPVDVLALASRVIE
jgi:putative ABC transport system substrate-binding protein